MPGARGDEKDIGVVGTAVTDGCELPAMSVLGIEPVPSAGTSTVNCWAIFQPCMILMMGEVE